MVRQNPERVLIIGDSQRLLQSALAQALPNVEITSVSTVFDGIGELSVNSYSTILASAEPIERRPEPAVRMLRQLAGDSKLVLFGHPTLEVLSRKMMEFGCDDYIITPPRGEDLRQLFAGRSLRMGPRDTEQLPPVMEEAGPSGNGNGNGVHFESPAVEEDAPGREEHHLSERRASDESGDSSPLDPEHVRALPFLDPVMDLAEKKPAATSQPAPPQALPELPFADIFLDALLHAPGEAPEVAVRMLNERLAPDVELRYLKPDAVRPEAQPGCHVHAQPIMAAGHQVAVLYLLTFTIDHDGGVEAILKQLAHLVGKLATLKERHNRLKKLSITDDLTGVYNARYFRHFLSRIIERAKVERFNVTLLLFDIDDFKKYNDQYGHGAGDQILKQTAKLMKRCCREHDLVARIGGDEFAVVFWDKEGPRQPLDPNVPKKAVARPPQTPLQIFERFKRLAASSDLPGLGASGRGKLSVSGGLAVYPFDAHDVPSLIKAADDYLMFKAKKAGKNSIYLVEGQENGHR